MRTALAIARKELSIYFTTPWAYAVFTAMVAISSFFFMGLLQTFQEVQNAFCRLVDETNGQELARYTLSGGYPAQAMVMAKLVRHGGGWGMQAIGEAAAGRTALDLVGTLQRLV